MRVQLAVPWTDAHRVRHDAGIKVQVTPEVGRQLIIDGHAAPVGIGEDVTPEPARTKPARKPRKAAVKKAGRVQPSKSATAPSNDEGPHEPDGDPTPGDPDITNSPEGTEKGAGDGSHQ